jgi:predicted CxxxxCH...CXXCH cytochrome family protein
VGAVSLVVALACGQARQVSSDGSSTDLVAKCTQCHGDPARAASPVSDPLIAAAPPVALRGGQNPTDAGVGAHQRHLAGGAWFQGVACASCHAVPAASLWHPPQQQGRVTFSGVAAAVWPGAPAIHPTWNGTSCSATYCHGAFPGGDAGNAPAWTAARADGCGTCHGLPPASPHPPAPGGLDRCRTCHPDPFSGSTHVNGHLDVLGHDALWVDPASPSFHAFSANQGIAACQGCHGADLSGSFTGVACASCHDGGVHDGVTVVAFEVGGVPNCVACHGGADDQGGAPPEATWGNAGDAVRVGAHSTHVAAGYDCAVCHLKPADMLSPGHIDGPTAEVVFGGLALAGPSTPTWDRGAARCGSTYCHGGTLTGGSNSAPDWTRVGVGEAACGTCHGKPPAQLPSPSHPVYVFAAACVGCHPATATVDGTGQDVLVQGGTHLNGGVEYTFAGHPAGWAVPGAGGGAGGLHSLQGCMGCGLPPPGWFDMSQYYTLCTPCHGSNGNFVPWGGTSRVSCGACHPAFFNADGTTSCNFCH